MDNLIIIDTRTKQEYDSGHIENAILIPYDEVRFKIHKYVPNKEAKIALYCRSGQRSGVAAFFLHQIGYRNATNYGGIVNAAKRLDLEIV